jgi:4-aminobutyrate aminotransferase
LPDGLLVASQVLIGWALGQSITRDFFVRAPRVLASAALVTLGILMLCLGLAWLVSLGAGLPLSAAVGPAWVMDSGTASSLLTSAANPICARAGRTMLDILQRDSLTDRARDIGEQIRRDLEQGVVVSGVQPLVGDVRGRGLTIGIDLVAAGDVTCRAPDLARKAVYRAWQLGAVVFYVGGNVLEVTPPLTISADEARDGVSILLQAIAEAEQVSDEEVSAFAGW